MATYRYSDAFWLKKTLQLLMILLLWFLLLRVVSYEPKATETADLGSSQVSVAVIQNESSTDNGPLAGLTANSVSDNLSVYSVGQSELRVYESASPDIAAAITWEYTTVSNQLQLTDTPLDSCGNDADCVAESGDVTILVAGDSSAEFVIYHKAEQGVGLSEEDVQAYSAAIERYSKNSQGAL